MNYETLFECVPNALFKMYGNRDAGRSEFIADVADGGIDYDKSTLDSNQDIDKVILSNDTEKKTMNINFLT